jgi:hypothetical protein
MSARKQGGQLRAILVRKLRSSGLSEEMVSILQKGNQVYTGTLSQSILKRDLAKSLSISYKINKEIDIIENVVVTFVNRVSEPNYAPLVDKTLGAFPTQKIDVSAREIESWIFAKVKNGTWSNQNGANYKKTVKSNRGDEKTYLYPLSNKKARASLAFVIARSINKKQTLKNRSPFLVNPIINLRAEFAILSGLEEFNQLWLQDLGVESIKKVISLFQ